MTAYVPILAVERGQLDGLAAAADAVRAHLTPLFEASSPESCLLGSVAHAWDPGRVALFDLRYGRGDERVDDGRVHMAALMDDARSRGLALIPVTGLRRNAAYQLAVADAASIDCRGAGLRLEMADFQDLRTLAADAIAFPDRLAVSPEDIDVVIDLGHVADGQLTLLNVTARAVLAALASAGPWRSVAIAASALPPEEARNGSGRRLRERPAAEPPAVARTEWLLWRALVASPLIDAPLRFADYGAQWPATGRGNSALGERRERAAAERIYYTSETEWLVLDASASRDADALVRREAFRGAGHCAGDAFLAGRTNPPTPGGISSGPAGGPAGDAAWRAAATAHHLTVVVEQLAAAGAPGAAA